jgi:ubiquinone/menaquinone biosynthesis C-methylase UbiE
MNEVEFQDLYDTKYFRATKKFAHNKKRLDEIINIVLSFEPKRVLDVGCGFGLLVRGLQACGVEAYGTDRATSLLEFWDDPTHFVIADSKSLPFKDKEFDVVISTDFFEHVPEHDIPFVYSEMQRVGKVVLARVAFERPLTAKQQRYHMTNKPKSWWEHKLQGAIFI